MSPKAQRIKHLQSGEQVNISCESPLENQQLTSRCHTDSHMSINDFLRFGIRFYGRNMLPCNTLPMMFNSLAQKPDRNASKRDNSMSLRARRKSRLTSDRLRFFDFANSYGCAQKLTVDPADSPRRRLRVATRACRSSSYSHPNVRATPAPCECPRRPPASASRNCAGRCGNSLSS